MRPTDDVKACLEQRVPQLTGLTITEGVVDDSGEYWGFTAKGQQGTKTVEKTVFVTSDAEGNHAGFLEINDGVEPDAPGYTEWCPRCSAETGYRENQPFPCPVCGDVLLPCSICPAESAGHGAACDTCPWESKNKEEVESCLQV
jgi:hypothetical protein